MLTKTVLLQLLGILAPALIMTAILARSPAKTLLLRWPRWWTLVAAVGLAVAMHPVAVQIAKAIETIYPMNPKLKEAAEALFKQMPGLTALFLVVAVIGPICEEVAYRGFILSGFRHLGRRYLAIVLSSIFFGLAHGIVQQSLLATLLGMLIAFVAIQTGSLFAAILYHVTHNGLMLAMACGIAWANSSPEDPSWLQRALRSLLGTPEAPGVPAADGWLYHWSIVAVFAFFAGALLWAFARLPHEKTEEETLQEALRHQASQPPAQEAY
jgi:sodium transport system permease protein